MRLSHEKRTSFLIAIMFLQLLFLYVFNDINIFPDTLYYIQLFNYISNVEWLDVPFIQHFYANVKPDIGWFYYLKILSFLFNDTAILLFTTGLIIILTYLILIRKHSLIPWLSIFLFTTIVFYDSLFILRQYLAVAVCFLSIPYIIERKIWKFLLVISIAFTIHQTAFIFILLYFLYPFNLNRYFIPIIISTGIFLYVITAQNLLYFFSDLLFGYAIYSQDVFLRSNYTSLIISIGVFLFIGICYYPFNQIDKYDKLFIFMLVLIFFIDFARIGLPGTIGRLNIFFSPAVIILLPNAIKRIKTHTFKYISITAISVLYFILMINQMSYGFKLIF